MKVYPTLKVLGLVYLGLLSTTTIAQNKQKVDLSAAMPSPLKSQDVDKLNYTYALEVENQVYSGYSALGINPKSSDHVKIEQGLFQVGTTTYDKKVILSLKEGHKSDFMMLDQWAKQNITHKGNAIFMIDQVVLNAQSSTVLVDQNYILDYAVIPLDKANLDQAVVVVQLRMKTVKNFKDSSVAKKKKGK